MSSSAPIVTPHGKKTLQKVYDDSIISECAERFGTDSVEYGLAIAGSHKLGALLNRHVLSFTPDSIVMVSESHEHAAGIVASARRSIAIRDLRERVEQSTFGKKEDDWL